MGIRPYWSGQIRLSLVSLPVNLYSAVNRTRQLPLHEIHRATGERVRHQNVAGDTPISREEIIKGYEVEKGRYVLIEPEEIEKLKIPSRKTLDIVQFVDEEAIPPLYFDTPYYVAPDGQDAADAFIVIREALRDSGKVGIGQLAMAGRERLCAIRPWDKGILLETMRYSEEIRDTEPYFEDIGDIKVDKEQLDLAKELIRRKTDKFDPEQFHDRYRDALQELINAKLEDREPEPIEEGRPPGKVINLMDALRRSLNEPEKTSYTSSSKTRPKTKPRRSKPTPRKRTG